MQAASYTACCARGYQPPSPPELTPVVSASHTSLVNAGSIQLHNGHANAQRKAGSLLKQPT